MAAIPKPKDSQTFPSSTAEKLISYSLYLVHGTVLFAMEAVLKNRVSPFEFFLFFIPAAVLLSWLFYLAVERPFMEWSRRVGKRSKPMPKGGDDIESTKDPMPAMLWADEPAG